MNTKVAYIPQNWKPFNHKAIAEWMQKLPQPTDMKLIEQIDEKYETLIVLKNITK